MNYSTKQRAYIWLGIAGEGSIRFTQELLNCNEDAEELYEAVQKGKACWPVNARREKIEKFKTLASDMYIDDFIYRMEKCGVRAVTLEDEEYPDLLRNIYDPPFALFCRGKALGTEIKLPFAIVGSRHCSDYGEQMSSMFGRVLAENGMTIVSGLAYGGDSFAAQGALLAKANPIPTVAVLGQGVCIRKHDSTADLMDEILERGLVVSEMYPWSPPTRYSFPMRNRLISGMSEGVLITEAGEKSGTMITANCALEQGRMLFAVPGRITDRMSRGTNSLLQEGMAQAVYGVSDILDYYGISTSGEPSEDSGKYEKLVAALGESQKLLYELILRGEKSFDTLSELSGQTIEELNLNLTELEFSGLIKQLPGRFYAAV